MSFNNSIFTAPEQTLSPNVMGDCVSTPIDTSGAANTDTQCTDPVSLNNQGTSTIIHTRLLTCLETSRIRLAFLIKCRRLKRPPPSLRVKPSKLIDKETAIKVCSTAESTILESTILSKQLEVRDLEESIDESNTDMLQPVNIKEIKGLL